MWLIKLILAWYILGIVFLIIQLAFDIQKECVEQEGKFYTFNQCLKSILDKPSPLLFKSWYGVYMLSKDN